MKTLLLLAILLVGLGSSDPCKEKPCGGGGSCVNLYDTFFCLCVQGYYYNTSASVCEKGKTFPGDVKVKVDDTSDLNNKRSLAYQKLHDEVNAFFKDAFKNTDYQQTVILSVSLSPSQATRSAVRAGAKEVKLSIVNIFAQNTKENKDGIAEKIHAANNQNSNIISSSYDSQNPCEYYGCENNASDDCQDALQCTCKAGFERPNPQIPGCVSIPCEESCSSQRKEQCVKTDDGLQKCMCLPGYKRDSSGYCIECPFGYRGMDCEDAFQLILTIVGTVAGVLILSLLIALIVSVRSRSKKRNTEKQKLTNNNFQNLQLSSMGFTNFGAEDNIFPKARAGTFKNSQTPNPYIHQRNMLRPDY